MTKTNRSESYRMLAEAHRRKTGEIPLWSEETEHMLMQEKSNACFFTGHRELIARGSENEEGFRQALREWLDRQVESMHYRGYRTFLCGGARGFDLLAAAAVLHAKQMYYPELRLILLLPCREQTRGWDERDLALHLAVLECAEAYYLQEDYDRDCMHRRNRLLVDLSITGVAYYDPEKARSGTGMTVRYAERQGVPMLFMPLDGSTGPSAVRSTQEDDV